MDVPDAANVPEIVVGLAAVPARVPWSTIVDRVVEYENHVRERDQAQNNLNELQATLIQLQANPPTHGIQNHAYLVAVAEDRVQQAQDTLQGARTTCNNMKRQIIRSMRRLNFRRRITLSSSDHVRALRRARDWLGQQYGPLRYKLSNANARVYEDVQMVCGHYQIPISAEQPHDQNRIDRVLPLYPNGEDALVDGEPVV